MLLDVVGVAGGLLHRPFHYLQSRIGTVWKESFVIPCASSNWLILIQAAWLPLT